MADYISVPIDTDPGDLAQQIFTLLAAYYSGWTPNDGNLDVRLISAFSQIAAETRDLASDVPDTIFRTFGSAFLGVTPILGAGGNLSVTFTARDTIGYTIPANTLLAGTGSDGTLTYWATDQAYVIPAASSTVVGNVVSVELGNKMNGISYIAGQLVMSDDLEFIASVASTGSSSGGVDAETDATYQDRLRQELTLLTMRPILPNDFSVLAQNVPGVARATTIDLYDPGTNTYGNAKEVTVYVADISGLDPGSTVRTAVDVYLQALREVNFIVNVRAASYQNVNTQYSVKAAAGVDPVALKVLIDAAIADYLNPANWGQPGFGDTVSWVNQPYVRYSGVMAAIQDVLGVDHVISLTIQLLAVGADYDMTAAGANGPVCLPHWQPTGTGPSTGVVS